MSERTLMRKIQAKLPEHKRLRKMHRSSRWYDEYGPYYILDAELNRLVAWGIDDLEKLYQEVFH